MLLPEKTCSISPFSNRLYDPLLVMAVFRTYDEQK